MWNFWKFFASYQKIFFTTHCKYSLKLGARISSVRMVSNSGIDFSSFLINMSLMLSNAKNWILVASENKLWRYSCRQLFSMLVSSVRIVSEWNISLCNQIDYICNCDWLTSFVSTDTLDLLRSGKHFENVGQCSFSIRIITFKSRSCIALFPSDDRRGMIRHWLIYENRVIYSRTSVFQDGEI